MAYFMVFYGRISSFLAVIDPNSFGLVKVLHAYFVIPNSFNTEKNAMLNRRIKVLKA